MKTTNNAIIYLTDGDAAEAMQRAQQHNASEILPLGRRGYHVGWICQAPGQAIPSPNAGETKSAWDAMQAIYLPGFFADKLAAHQQDIEQAQQLSEAVLDGESCDDLFSQEPYLSRLSPKFELLAATCDESDDQEIETLDFDVMQDDEVIAEGLWVKASWLSFVEEDASLRFRFSFGIVGYEDVAADYERQQYAAELTEAIFPHSSIISDNQTLQELLSKLLDVKHVDYVERIIYFNAPEGGAQFHQDVERGHAGVVFAQMFGRTAWLAISKQQLIKEILHFIANDNAHTYFNNAIDDPTLWQTLLEQCQDTEKLNSYLDEADNEAAEYLINRVPQFAKQLIENGFAFILNPGDAILLPQENQSNCCWHSVFCIDEHPGQALSFAIRESL